MVFVLSMVRWAVRRTDRRKLASQSGFNTVLPDHCIDTE